MADGLTRPPEGSRNPGERLPRHLLLAGAALLLLIHGNLALGLFESSEARYAEVAREMAETGDFLSPKVNGVDHFTKPPLAYWITSAGYLLFGVNGFGARFFPAVAAVLVLILTAWTFGLRVGRGGRWLAGLVLFCSVQFFILGKVVTTDMFLTLWITLALAVWQRMESGGWSSSKGAPLLGIVLAAAFLTKGPVPLLFCGVVLVPYSLWSDRGRSLRVLLSPGCWLLFLLLALPWFLAVGVLHPGLFSYFLAREATEAAFSAKRFHPGSWYYYAPVLLAGFYPWWILLAARWRLLGAREVRLWAVWAVSPLLVWSLFPAKLPTYILPALPAWALLAAWVLVKGGVPGRGLGAALAGGAAVVPLGILIYVPVWGSWLPPVRAQTLLVLAGSAVMGLLGAILCLLGRRLWSLAGLAACIGAFYASIPMLAVDMTPLLSIEKRIGEELASARLPDEPVLVYGVTLYSIPFYVRDRVAAYDTNFIRKKYVGEIPEHILRTRRELAAFLASHGRLWIVTDESEEVKLLSDSPALVLYLRDRNKSVWITEEVARRLGLSSDRDHHGQGLVRASNRGGSVSDQVSVGLDGP